MKGQRVADPHHSAVNDSLIVLLEDWMDRRVGAPVKVLRLTCVVMAVVQAAQASMVRDEEARPVRRIRTSTASTSKGVWTS